MPFATLSSHVANMLGSSVSVYDLPPFDLRRSFVTLSMVGHDSPAENGEEDQQSDLTDKQKRLMMMEARM